MAYKEFYGNRRNTKQRKSKFSQDEQLAFRLGKIQASLNNDCRVSDSYKAGLSSKSAEKKKNKPLY